VPDFIPINITNSTIVYPIALTISAHPAAAAFVAYLTGPRGREIFIKYGFTVPTR
jgi:ABC-type molybdate transport system substrate-binding protein